MTATAVSPEDLADLRAAVREFLAAGAPARQQLVDSDDPGPVWKRLTGELGLTALPVAEQHGGAGAGFVETAVALEETGRTLLRAPYLSTVVAAAVLQSCGADDLLPELADGSTTAALLLDGELTPNPAGLSGEVAQAVDAGCAGLLLVAMQDGLHVVRAGGPGVAVTPLTPLDATRPQARVVFAAAASRRVGDRTAVAHARDLQHVALAAECVGGAQRILELAVEHLQVREQFGRPLGSFQALRHRVADLTVRVEAARSTAWYAARAAAGGEADLPVVAPLAKAVCAEAFVEVAGGCLQLFGGIGFTWEHDAHLYFKRAWSTSLLHGDGRTLRRLAASRAGVLETGDTHG